MRAGLTALVYQEALEIRTFEQGQVTAMAILGADLPQIVAGLQMLHEIWASLVDVVIATWLLQRALSLACLAPVILVVGQYSATSIHREADSLRLPVFVGVTSCISGVAKVRQRRWIERIQTRLKATSSLLEKIKSMKMLGLTNTMSEIIESLRKDEIKASTAYRKVLLSVLLLCKMPSS